MLFGAVFYLNVIYWLNEISKYILNRHFIIRILVG